MSDTRGRPVDHLCLSEMDVTERFNQKQFRLSFCLIFVE